MADPISEGIGLARDLIGRFFPDKSEEERNQLALALVELQGQLATNTAEASNPSVFVSGWRPFVGWICGTGFAVQYVVGPFVTWGSALWGHTVNLPGLDVAALSTLLLGMLGLGGMRTVERLNKSNRV